MKHYTTFCKAYTIFTICVFIFAAIYLFYAANHPTHYYTIHHTTIGRIGNTGIVLFFISYIANYFLNLAHLLWGLGKGGIHRKLITTNAIIVAICIVLSIVFSYFISNMEFLDSKYAVYAILSLPICTFIGWLINAIYILTFKADHTL